MKKLNMTLSQKRKVIAATSLPISALVLMMGFQNCSPGIVQSQRLESVGNLSTSLEEDTKPVSVTYSENALLSMQQQVGIQTPSARTLTAANSARQKLSETGKADSVNAPAMIAVANLAGELCLDLITEEKAKAADARRFFNQINFTTGPTSISAAAKADIIRKMARNFWGRNETAAEKTVLTTSIDAAIADPRRTGQSDAVDTEDILIFGCTGMLASLDSITFK